MSIDPSYKIMYNQARNLQYKFQDMLGTSNPTASILHREAKDLVDDISMNKNPRDLENRIKTIQNHMKQVEHQGDHLMSYEHANGIHHEYEQMRQEVRNFHNYS